MPNRLAHETSPYLRQHQDNPVDWYPWGDEAFDRATAEDKPILLSVGYSACHWCHVMAHESFEDEATAALLNELFVSVKVDREERPDVDAVYMEAVQAQTGHGGWPMTVFLMPDRRPFFGGTYFPKQRHNQAPSFVELCHAIDDAWRNRRADLEEHAGNLSSAIGARTAIDLTPSTDAISPDLLRGGYESLRAQFDGEWGGFGRAPKFPQPSHLELLLRAHSHNGSEDTLAMVTTTLDAMASGGIYDHLGGGFSRYSVDAFWMVPHFEKMLYDQAGLARVYLHAWQVTAEPRHRQVVEEIISYVLRDLADPAGGFYSAEDADSEGEEGRFYVWRPEEIEAVLGREATSAMEWYGVTKAGNFEGSNILHRPVRGDLVRPAAIETARLALLEARAARVRPGLDDKVLTEWNAMFIATLAEAGAALGRADWVEAAERAADFLVANLRDAAGRWLRSWQRDGGARHLAYAADYAWLVDAFTRLAEATGRARWIDLARATADALTDLFWDADGAGFFTTGHDAERLIIRSKDLFDGATPSANAVAAVALMRLGSLTGESRYSSRAEEVVRLLHSPLEGHPAAFSHLLAGADMMVTGTTEIVITGDRADLVSPVHQRFLPNAVLAWGERYDSPLWEARADGLAYVCRNFACQAPVDSPAALIAQLAGP